MNLFLSTPSARRATSIASAKPSAIAISIHALREEGDNLVRWCLHLQRNFYPRPPRGGRRRIGAAHVQHDPISIHALREEGDDASEPLMSSMTRFLSTPSARRATRRYIRRRACCRDFYPRPPRGGRRMGFPSSFTSSIFLSTPSARRATRWLCIRAMPSLDFYPRPPRGGRLHCWDNVQAANEFLSTPSARRAT